MSSRRVVVVGAGITGLAAAATLQAHARRARQPLDLTVVEHAPRAGGHVRTIHADGFVIEAGPNGFLNREPEVLALVDEMRLTPRLVSARPEAARRFILRNNRLCQVPSSPASLITTPALSWRGKLRLAMEPFAPGPPGGDETVYAFASRRIGAEAADMLVDAAVSGISAGDSRALSLRSQFPMMAEMERDYGSLVRAMFSRRSSGKGPPVLLSFDRGMAALPDALTARLGDALRLDWPVQQVRRDDREWIVRGPRGEVRADDVLLATPARVTATLMRAQDQALAAALGATPYAGVGVVALGYRVTDIPRALDGYGYLATRGEGLTTLGVVWESSLFPGRAKDGTVLVRAILGGSRTPSAVDSGESALVETARAELRRVMQVTAEPLHVSAVAWPQAIAQYVVGHEERVRDIRQRVAAFPGLSVCGTGYDGVSFNHAVKAGRQWAHRLAEREGWMGSSGPIVASRSAEGAVR
ncbi:MAG: protoporphyrinogen oxidase [Acidobacteria bacterium]|nr:protoporphyrinogen oxidase [Acidobacteriota bacterium]